MTEPPPQGPVALVLAGGCARGAYEFGALSVLLPALEDRGQRPTIVLGTSVGALNAAYLAAEARRPAREVVAAGEKVWRDMRFTDISDHLLSLASAGSALAYLGQVLGVPGARLRELLDPAPLRGTIERNVDFRQLARNVADGPLAAAAVVATSNLTHRTVVFHDGGGEPPFDAVRRIDYVQTCLAREHVQASTAMPSAFPAVHVERPTAAAGWYYDGGTRQNAPLKPALAFGASRLVVVALSSLAPGPPAIAGPARPDVFAGMGMILQGLFGDQLVQDIYTLAETNLQIQSGDRREGQLVPYIVIAPERHDAVERLALRVFRERYCGPRGWLRSTDIALLGRLTGAGAEAANATMLSLLLFDPVFIDELIERGKADAASWLEQEHDGDDGPWQLGPVGAWLQSS